MFEAKCNLDSIPKTIMIVDDDSETLTLLELVLKNEGLNVLTARNGQEALESLENIKVPQLILSDLTMPKMNGLELLAELKSKSKTKEIPIIVSSALPVNQVRDLALGASAYLAKPYDLEQLISLVKTHLN